MRVALLLAALLLAAANGHERMSGDCEPEEGMLVNGKRVDCLPLDVLWGLHGLLTFFREWGEIAEPTREVAELCEHAAPALMRRQQCAAGVTQTCAELEQLVEAGRGVFEEGIPSPSESAADLCALCAAVGVANRRECESTLSATLQVPPEPPTAAALAQQRDIRLARLIAAALHAKGRIPEGADPDLEAADVCARLARTRLLEECHSDVAQLLRGLLGPAPPRAVLQSRSMELHGMHFTFRHYEGASFAAEAEAACTLPFLRRTLVSNSMEGKYSRRRCEISVEKALRGEEVELSTMSLSPKTDPDQLNPLLPASQRLTASADAHFLRFTGFEHLRPDAFRVVGRQGPSAAAEEARLLCARDPNVLVREIVEDCEATLTAFIADLSSSQARG